MDSRIIDISEFTDISIPEKVVERVDKLPSKKKRRDVKISDVKLTEDEKKLLSDESFREDVGLADEEEEIEVYRVKNPILDLILEKMDNVIDTSHFIPGQYHKSKKSKSPDEPKMTELIQDPFEPFKQKITKLINSDPEFEIEASLGTYSKNGIFAPGLKSSYSFDVLRDYFKNLYDSSNTMEYFESVDMVTTIPVVKGEDGNKIMGTTIRRVQNKKLDHTHYERKVRHKDEEVNIKSYGVRISKSTEKQPVEGEKTFNFHLGYAEHYRNTKGDQTVYITRERYRQSFEESSKKEIFYGVSIDLTFVIETYYQQGNKFWKKNKYEVEIERTKNIGYERFKRIVYNVFGLSQDIIEKRQFMDLKQKKVAIKLHNNFFYKDPSFLKWKTYDQFRLYGNYWNKPKNIKLKDLMDPLFDHFVTIKINGKRMTIIITDEGVFGCSPPFDIFKLGEGIEDSLNGTVIDCEFVKIDDYIMIYGIDLMFYKGEDIRYNKFEDRYKLLEEIDEDISTRLYKIFPYAVKTYYTDGDFYERTKNAFLEIKYDDIYREYDLQDGLVIVPRHRYKNNHTYKWKPHELLTIDFKLELITGDELTEFHETFGDYENNSMLEEFIMGDPENYYVFRILVGGKKRGLINFKGTKFHPYSGVIVLNDEFLDGRSIKDRVVECQWSESNKQFEPYKIRDDRDKPNDIETAASVWEDIMNPIPKETILGKTLQLMRKFHNNQKLLLLNSEFGSKDVILDIGSGRGGDINKWITSGIKKVYAVEPNGENSFELNRRLEGFGDRVDVEVLNMGAENTKLIKEIAKSGENPITGIVSFFSMTFFPQSRKMYDSFIKTINLIPVGGKFVGIVMDGNRTRDLIESVRNEEDLDENQLATYNSDTFSISQNNIFGDSAIGDEITIDLKDKTSMVKSQQEWLFYFDNFESDLASLGIKLESQGFLDKGVVFSKLPESSKVFSSLNRFFVFKKIEKLHRYISPKMGSSNFLENPYSKRLYYFGIKMDNQSFIRSILYCMYENFRRLGEKEKLDLIEETRNDLAEMLTKQIFNELHSGVMAERLTYHEREKEKSKGKIVTKEEAEDLAYLNFKEKIRVTSGALGEVSGLEICSMYLKTNIYVLVGSSNKVSKMYKNSCERVYSYDRSIIIYTPDNIKYHPVALLQKEKFIYRYTKKSNIISKIHEDLC